MSESPMTISDFLQSACQKLNHGDALAKLLIDIANVSIKIANLAGKGELANISDKFEGSNVQGETQTVLDVLSNDLFISALKDNGSVAGLVSEELETSLCLPFEKADGKFLVAFDPLDGSSNIPVNSTVGTIFSILPAPQKNTPDDQDYLQPGKNQLAAGYIAYGAACIFVLTIGDGTHAFTLHAATNQFYLTHQNIQIPKECSEFAINVSNERFWENPIKRYLDECKAGNTGPRGRNFNMRWVGSMVADIHRVLMRGGIYLYPRDNKQPVKAGRLRLLYEANPMSMLIEQAGGASSTGYSRILEIQPEDIHQRVPVIMGARSEVNLINEYHQSVKTI